MVNSYVINSPQPSNISYLWNFGSLLAFCLIIQIVTGVTSGFAFVLPYFKLCLSRPPKPHVFVDLPTLSGIGIGGNSDNNSSDGEDNSSSDEEVETKLSAYRRNEENIVFQYKTLISEIKEKKEDRDKRLIGVIEGLATRQESDVVREEERLEASQPRNKIKYEDFSDEACAVWMKAYQEVTNRTPAAIEAKLVEQAAEKLDELFNEREYLKKEIGLARETKEGTRTEEEQGETEMSKSEGKRPMPEEIIEPDKKPKKKNDDDDSDSDSGSITPTRPGDLGPSASSDTGSESGPSGTGPSNTFKIFFNRLVILLLTFIEISAEFFSNLL